MGNGHIKNEESARVSIPGQIKKYVLLLSNILLFNISHISMGYVCILNQWFLSSLHSLSTMWGQLPMSSPFIFISFVSLTASVSTHVEFKTYSNHVNLFPLILSIIGVTPMLPLIYSFLTLTSLVTPFIHLIILISHLFFVLFSCLLQHSIPYSIAGLTTTL